MKYIIDSSAWIEYLEGGIKGAKVNEILNSRDEFFTSVINIGEVVSYTSRNGGNTELAYNSIIKNSNILQITPKIAKEAGLLHSKVKKESTSFSLADAFMIQAAKILGGYLVTADNHFKSFKEAIIL